MYLRERGRKGGREKRTIKGKKEGRKDKRERVKIKEE